MPKWIILATYLVKRVESFPSHLVTALLFLIRPSLLDLSALVDVFSPSAFPPRRPIDTPGTSTASRAAPRTSGTGRRTRTCDHTRSRHLKSNLPPTPISHQNAQNPLLPSFSSPVDQDGFVKMSPLSLSSCPCRHRAQQTPTTLLVAPLGPDARGPQGQQGNKFLFLATAGSTLRSSSHDVVCRPLLGVSAAPQRR